jgi:DNA-binding NarL/FixJ family response regulator
LNTSPLPLPQPVRILVVDDHGIVRDGIALLLARESWLQVVGFAASGETAIWAAVRSEPDVIIMDLVLPDLNGVDATQRILQRLPRTRVIALSASHSAEHVHQAMRAGARGYVTKEALGTELVAAVRSVLAGDLYLGALVAGFATDGSKTLASRKSPIERLSAREREVLHRTVAGASTAEIARHLSLSPKTVDTYRSRLMHKLGVRNRTSLIRFAIEHGFAPT